MKKASVRSALPLFAVLALCLGCSSMRDQENPTVRQRTANLLGFVGGAISGAVESGYDGAGDAGAAIGKGVGGMIVNILTGPTEPEPEPPTEPDS